MEEEVQAERDRRIIRCPSRRPHNIKYKKVTSEIQETILDLRLTKRFGCNNRIKFRLKRIIGLLSLSTRTIYKTLKRMSNILKCHSRIRKYKRFAMKQPNDMVQMDILGPFYISNSSERNYIISCLDDCSRKVTSKWSERKRSVENDGIKDKPIPAAYTAAAWKGRSL